MNARIVLRVYLVSLMLFGIGSCSSDDPDDLLLEDGIYSGIFTVQYPGEPGVTNTVQVTLDQGTYASSAAANRMPAGGSGTFTAGTATIRFQDENVWTADFDWGLILSGEYRIQREEQTLILTKDQQGGAGFYRYELERQ